MDELQVIERIFAGLAQTPAFILVLLIVLVTVASPSVISWLNRRKGDNVIVPGLVKLMGDTNAQIVTNVELSRQAIERGNDVMAQMVAAVNGFNERAEVHFEETHRFLEPIANNVAVALQNDAASAERQAEILARLDTVERQMTEAVNAIMTQFSDHENRAAGRTATITAAIEEKIGSVLAEIKQLRAELTTAPRPME